MELPGLIPGSQRFDSFHVYCTSYKKIRDHEIEVGILVPRSLRPGVHPVFVRFHGGGLVSGTWSYSNWFANWQVSMVHRNDAIVLSPNYRLLPEHNGEEIQEDLRDFWTWFQDGGVEKYLTSQDVDLELDHKRVLVGGDSAGGYLAIQSGLIRPKGEIRAIVGSYPMTNYLRREQQEIFMGEPAPPPSIIDEHLANVGPGAIISGAQPRPRNRISYALSAYGRYNEFFGIGTHLWPISLLPQVGYLPSTLILHGNADTAVIIGDSRGFVDMAERIMGDEADVRLVELEGMDHGFDMDAVESEDWVKDVAAWIEKRWLG